jgi:hypothetical protein
VPIDYKIEVLGKKLSAKEWWFSCNIKLAVFACRFLYRSMDKTSFLVIEGVKWSACPPQTLDCSKQPSAPHRGPLAASNARSGRATRVGTVGERRQQHTDLVHENVSSH